MPTLEETGFTATKTLYTFHREVLCNTGEYMTNGVGTANSFSDIEPPFEDERLEVVYGQRTLLTGRGVYFMKHVVLAECDPEAKISQIKVIRAITGMGLRDAKQLVDLYETS